MIKRNFSSAPSRFLAALGLLVAAPPLHAALTFPGCTDLVAADFKEVVLVSRGTSPAPMVQDNTLFEPVSLFVGADGRVYWAELTNSGAVTGTTPVPNDGTSATGRVRRFNPADSSLKTVATFPVATSVQSGQVGNKEYGLRYFTLDPNYAVNKFAYVVYTPPTSVTGRGVDTMLLSRFYMPTPDSLDKSTEKKLLKMAWSPGICCHQGGALDWDAQGNLYMTTGNNTENSDDFAPMDTSKLGATGEAKDRATKDNQARTANTMDWRGKILRIRPDNSIKGYSIPAGNLRQRLFEIGGAWVAGQDTNKILPEIYTFGHRNPYSIAVDRVTGWVAIGEVGPDNGTANLARGPIGREEYSIIRRPGFHGFPYFIGEDSAGYAMFNPATNSYNLPKQKPDSVTNTSPHTTGILRLPRATAPTLSNTRAGSQHPGSLFTTTGGSAFTGPIYNFDNNLVSAKKLPPHLHRKWIIFENSRSWVKVATFNDSGVVTDLQDWPGYASLFRGSSAVSLIDMKVGPEGAMYVAGYNAGFFQSTANTRITRVEYKGTCQGTVAVNRSAAEKRDVAMRGVLYAPASGSLVWAEGMTRAEAFDMQGKKAFSATRAPGETNVAVPRNARGTLLRVRFAP